jgi:hypothetical protein
MDDPVDRKHVQGVIRVGGAHSGLSVCRKRSHPNNGPHRSRLIVQCMHSLRCSAQIHRPWRWQVSCDSLATPCHPSSTLTLDP